jgi:laminin, gamma 1
LDEIASNPTVIDDDEFSAKLDAVKEKIKILVDDAKSGAGGGDQTLVEKLNELNNRLSNVKKLLDESDALQEVANHEIQKSSVNITLAENTIQEAQNELQVSGLGVCEV